MPHSSINGISDVDGIHDTNSPRCDGVSQRASDDLSDSIAIVGISCKFGGAASDLEGLWHTLSSGASCWSPVPKSRFDVDQTYHPDASRTDSVGDVLPLKRHAAADHRCL